MASRPVLNSAKRLKLSFRHASSSSKLSRTPLYSLHANNHAKFAPFAGYEMPLQYAPGGPAEHVHTRKAASLFDVSHMVQSRLSGLEAAEFLAWLTPSSLSTLKYTDNSFSSTLSVFLNPFGGILDDLMITRQGENSFYLVTNAGRRQEDLTWIRSHLTEWNSKHATQIQFNVLEDKALVALQGPASANVLTALSKSDFTKMYFGQSVNAQIADTDAHIARSGYTGEDGFEISIPADKAVAFTERLLQDENVKLAGLAARDSLRIEAGLCLYGSDISEDTTPIEAGLAFVIGKDRRSPNAFIGAARILEQLAKEGPGPAKRRIGLTVQGAPARQGARIFDASGETEIGIVTSGIPSPTLGQNIAMGYVQSGHHKKDTAVKVEVRKKLRDATITKMPFVAARYFRQTAPVA